MRSFIGERSRSRNSLTSIGVHSAVTFAVVIAVSHVVLGTVKNVSGTLCRAITPNLNLSSSADSDATELHPGQAYS